MDWPAFNEAVADYRFPWFSGDTERIDKDLGPEAVALAVQMVAFADDHPDLWESEHDWVAVQPEMSRRLRVEYPLLSEPAADRIALAAAYSWKQACGRT